MEHGIITDWNDMERVWQYIYSKDQLQVFQFLFNSVFTLSYFVLDETFRCWRV